MMDDKTKVFKTSLPAPSEIYNVLEQYLKDLEAAGINPIVWLATRGLNLAGSSSFDFPETSFTGKNSEQAKGLLGIIAKILASLA